MTKSSSAGKDTLRPTVLATISFSIGVTGADKDLINEPLLAQPLLLLFNSQWFDVPFGLAVAIIGGIVAFVVVGVVASIFPPTKLAVASSPGYSHFFFLECRLLFFESDDFSFF